MELPGAIELKGADEFVVDRLPEDSSVFDATEKPSALYAKIQFCCKIVQRTQHAPSPSESSELTTTTQVKGVFMLYL